MKNKVPNLLAAVTCAISLVVMVLVLSAKPKPVQEVFTIPPFAADAQVGTPVVAEGLEYTTLSHEQMSFAVALCGKPVLVGNTAQIYLTSPAENTVWLKLRVLDASGAILGETGLIKPGEYLENITFGTPPADGQPITLKIMSYEMDTYYSMGAVSLNTNIQVQS